MGGITGSWALADRRVPARRLWLAAALVLLNVADVALTRAVLAAGGVEANPLMAGLMSGFAAPLGLKAVIAGSAGLLLMACPDDARIGERAAIAVVGLYAAIVSWNSVVLTLQLLR